jgi:hypothetical protein
MKKSRRRSSALFQSRFLAKGHEAAPLRHARQLREHLAGQVVQVVLMVGFAVALGFFARSILHLFERHGAGLSPWYLRLCLGGILVCFVLVVRRIVARIQEILWLRRELAETQRKLRELRDQLRGQSRD